MQFALYNYGDNPIKQTKVRGSTPRDEEDKYERHKESQRKYYKERGAFLSYLRKIEKKLDMDIHELSHITSIQELDLWCRDLILERLDIDIKEQATLAMYKYCFAACKKRKSQDTTEYWNRVRAMSKVF